MSILNEFQTLLSATMPAFAQRRTFNHDHQLAYGVVVMLGCRTISRAICACNDQSEDWSAKYRLFSRVPWQPAAVFDPVLKSCLAYSREGHFMVALDDTTIKKTGKKVPGVGYSRDPMSPPFRINLRRGQRFIQTSAIIRPEGLKGPARGIPMYAPNGVRPAHH